MATKTTAADLDYMARTGADMTMRAFVEALINLKGRSQALAFLAQDGALEHAVGLCRQEAKVAVSEGLDDMAEALDANMGAAMASATYYASFRLAGLRAAQAMVWVP